MRATPPPNLCSPTRNFHWALLQFHWFNPGPCAWTQSLISLPSLEGGLAQSPNLTSGWSFWGPVSILKLGRVPSRVPSLAETQEWSKGYNNNKGIFVTQELRRVLEAPCQKPCKLFFGTSKKLEQGWPLSYSSDSNKWLSPETGAFHLPGQTAIQGQACGNSWWEVPLGSLCWWKGQPRIAGARLCHHK